MIPLRRRAEPTEIAQMILFIRKHYEASLQEIGDCDGGITVDGDLAGLIPNQRRIVNSMKKD